MTLEDQLLEGLVKHYELGNTHLISILDNQMFKSLPLDNKVKFIKDYKEELSKTPKYDYSKITKGFTTGATIPLLGIGLSQLLTKGKIVDPKMLGAAVGVSGVLGGLIEGYLARSDLSKKRDFIEKIDSPINALIGSSMIYSNRPDDASTIKKRTLLFQINKNIANIGIPNYIDHIRGTQSGASENS